LHTLRDVTDDGVTARTAPHKARVREAVDGVPRGLGREEIIHAAQLHELRQAGAETEQVRQPENARTTAGKFFKRLLSENKAASERLAAGDVRIAFHIHAAGRLPFTGTQALADLARQRGRTTQIGRAHV